jgi:glycosyltransferase involved in cell wall biosynthesis
MRIALVTHYYPAHRGGIELVAAELARRLAAAHGAAISWHASDCDPAPAIAGVACEPARAWNGIERRAGVPYPIWSPGALRRLARAARAADAVHLHDCLYLPNLVAYAAARLAGRPVLVTQHIGPVPYRNPALRVLQVAAYRTLGRMVLGGAAQVVFVSDTVRRYFSSFVSFRAPPELVASGVDTALFQPASDARRAALRRELGAAPDAPLLLFVGRFVEKKGLPLLRQLAERMPQARWLFAGWGPLDPAAWRLPNVQVLHGLSGSTLAPLYQAADLLVLPSVGEGFPLVVQEAMACGTPALVSEATASGSPAAAGLLAAGRLGGSDDAERWMAGIGTLLRSPDLRPRVAAFARENWSWDVCAGHYAGVLHRLVRPAAR